MGREEKVEGVVEIFLLPAVEDVMFGTRGWLIILGVRTLFFVNSRTRLSPAAEGRYLQNNEATLSN